MSTTVRAISLALFIGSCLGVNVASATLGEWELEDNAEGVKVYKKEVAESPVLAFKGEGTIDASPLKIASVIFDSSRAHEWIVDLVSSQIVRWIDHANYVEYDHLHLPLFLKDRDFLSKVKIEFEKSSQTIRYVFSNASETDVSPQLPVGSSAKPLFVLDANHVRGNLMNTVFEITPIGDGKTSLFKGEVHADPKGSIPKWLVNFFQKDWPLDTFRGLRKQSAKADVKDDEKLAQILKKLAE